MTIDSGTTKMTSCAFKHYTHKGITPTDSSIVNCMHHNVSKIQLSYSWKRNTENKCRNKK